ncbi:M23 family metallopeptidase [Herbihabitans rhizosphaerae]|nr:M23 family metallopeptidase [Herbihabitans rhizosphaerae]
MSGEPGTDDGHRRPPTLAAKRANVGGGAHRLIRRKPHRRVAAAAVAAGALVGVGYPLTANAIDPSALAVMRLASTTDAPATESVPVPVEPARPDARAQAAQLEASEALRLQINERARAAEQARQAAVAAEQARLAAAKVAEERARQQAAAKPAPAVQQSTGRYARPAVGRFTSGFGGRWGTTHYGVDIANSIGTPILAAAAGTIEEAGPASGFGLWVRVRHEDGTVTVYGHVNTITVSEGQRVQAGQQIATMGNRGQSTGPHLHFEVWLDGGRKVNPVPWLAERGITL